MTTVSLLTPPGVGAIAVIEVAGPVAWSIVRSHFQTNGHPLPESPHLHRTWLGRLDDEVVLAVKRVDPEPIVEIHAHGGVQVVKRMLRFFQDEGCLPLPAEERFRPPVEQARTLRTASILLDQSFGSFERAMRDSGQVVRLAQLAPVGRHLVEPWKIVIAGAPNVGKSSLVNAIAGYERSIVSPVAGTTRDVVTTFVALDGWPFLLADTAGLRRATETLEAEGIALARNFLTNADLVIWLIDGTVPDSTRPDVADALVVVNKCDLPTACVPPLGSLCVSARTGDGIPQLIAAIVSRLIPVGPEPGEVVPYLPELADQALFAAESALLASGCKP